MIACWPWVYLPLLFAAVRAQDCQNFGAANGSTCICPPGFGGADCSSTACGGTIFQGSSRQTVASSPQGNLTSSGCACEPGWTGTGCNVCQTSTACQSGYSSISSPSTGNGLEGSGFGGNSTLVCNAAPKVWAAGEMSCSVNNPTLQAIYPGTSTLNILRTRNATLTPLPNITATGVSNTAYAQLFYDGVEQFYCHADTCTQDSQGGNDSSWECQNLQCHCLPQTTFCGGVPSTNLTNTINGLVGNLGISCDESNSCSFKQSVLQSLFGSSGLSLSGCSFGECVRQSVIDGTTDSPATSADDGGSSLSNGVIAGLAVVGGLIGIAFLLFIWGWVNKSAAAKTGGNQLTKGGAPAVNWANVSYVIPGSKGKRGLKAITSRWWSDANGDDKVILDNVSGHVEPGQMMAILGPSGAGKTTLVEILASKSKTGKTTGSLTFPSPAASPPRVGFVPQQDVLPATLTVEEALLFAARLRLPESVTEQEKQARVEEVMHQLGIASLRDVRIGNTEKRGVSGGEMRRVSIAMELVASVDVLILDEPTSGLDSVSAARVARVLQAVAHDPENPTVVIASIHQPSSQLYHQFDRVLVLSHGRTIYHGPGGFAPSEHLTARGVPYQQGYNVADHLLEVASDPPLTLFQGTSGEFSTKEASSMAALAAPEMLKSKRHSGYATTFLTQLQVISGREWKTLRRDKSLFITHVAVSTVLGVFCGGLYYQTGVSIAGFQSRVGCLFFLGALIAFSSLSALYNIVEVRPLFMRERSSAYYSPTAWLSSRFIFDVVPLRIIPTIIVSTITYWMAGLAGDAAHFFKFLFILVLYTLAMTLWNFLLGCLFRNGGIAILLSALSALYQMTFAGFFVHLNTIPPVLRWLQWLCPLKYTLEALSVNEVGSGLMIQDTLEGVPVDVSASLIMNLLFGFSSHAYYRDVLVLFAFIAGFAISVIFVVWLKVRERR